MKALLIKDLSLTSELDGKAMAAVVGGCGAPTMPGLPGCGSSGYPGTPGSPAPQLDFAKSILNFDASQSLSQSQNTVVNNGNNVAFSSGISANVNPHQTGKNTINFG